MNDSDAHVFFGATGDLAYKKIFPSLQPINYGRGPAIALKNTAASILRTLTSLAACCDMLPAITMPRQLSRPSARHLGLLSGRLTIWRFRQPCSRWSSDSSPSQV